MSYAKQFPIRVTLSEEMYDSLIQGLKGNEDDFQGFIAEEARALREKIERYGRHEPREDGSVGVHLGFYENEGVKFIWQFLAASSIANDYRELSKIGEDDGNDKM